MDTNATLPPVASITPGPLETLSILRRTVRNPMDGWPQAVYTDRLVRTRMLGRTTWWVSAPDLVQRALVDENDSIEKAEPMRRALEPALGPGILTAEGARWKFQRRVAAPMFRATTLDSFVPAMIAGARQMRDEWAEKPDGAAIDASRDMMRVTFAIILETMLSGAGNVNVPAVESAIRDFLESTSWAIVLSALRAPSWTPYPGRLRADRGRHYLRDMVAARLAERRRTGERRDDLLSLILDAKDPETGESLSDSSMVDNMLTFIGAGHETTALALTWTWYLLSKHPDIEARVLAEIAAVTGGAPVEAGHVPALVYTKQVIQESMRVYPPVAMIVREAVADFTLDSEQVRAGDHVFFPIYATHHHATLWDEPAVFNPDRFEPEAARARHRFAYMPFGAGPRICIGMGFALLEAVAILATLLPAARLEADQGFVPTPKVRVTMRPAEGMRMTLRKRVDRR
jgi:cytochrome P450